MNVGRTGKLKGGRISFEASPRSTIDAFARSKAQNKTTKSVSFVPKDQLVQELPPCTTELTEDDIDTFWYTKDEYRLSNKSQCFIIRMMEKGLSLDDDDELCPRGLETRTRSSSTRKNLIIDSSRDAVLWEQERQWQEGRFSSLALARVYSQTTAQSSMAAYLTGKRDAQYVDRNAKSNSDG